MPIQTIRPLATDAQRLADALEALADAQIRIAEKLDELVEIQKTFDVSYWGLPFSKGWAWQVFNLSNKFQRPFTIPAGQTFTPITEKDLLFKKGFVHSMDMGLSDINLTFDLILNDPRARKIELKSTFSALRAAAYSELIPAPGMPVVIDRAGLSPTLPQVAVRIPPSNLIPFNTPFQLNFINTTSSPILIYDLDVFFLLFE